MDQIIIRKKFIFSIYLFLISIYLKLNLYKIILYNITN